MKNYVKTFENFISDMEFPKDCEHCGEHIMCADEESVTYPGMCLSCDRSTDDETVNITCSHCDYNGPMDTGTQICPNCKESTGIEAVPGTITPTL